MLGNRHLQVKVVKDASAGTDAVAPSDSTFDLDKAAQVAAIAQATTDTAVKAIATAFIAKRLIDTACEIAIIIAKQKIK